MTGRAALPPHHATPHGRSSATAAPAPAAFFCRGQEDNDINLMKACWNELFALGLAQCSNVMNVATILSAIISHLQTSLQEGRTTLFVGNETTLATSGHRRA